MKRRGSALRRASRDAKVRRIVRRRERIVPHLAEANKEEVPLVRDLAVKAAAVPPVVRVGGCQECRGE